MTKIAIASGAFATMLALLVLAVVNRAPEPAADLAAAASPSMTPSTAAAYEGLLFGRVTTEDGESYEGRLRWGGDEEALWSNYFNGFKDVNPWVAYAGSEVPKERQSIELFGIEIVSWERQIDLGRPFMARFGDIARIEPRGRKIRVTLKSGTVFELKRFAADDLADGLRVWDNRRGMVDLGEWQIRSIELLPTGPLGAAPKPLHGTVYTRHGEFTGLIQWDREASVWPDELRGLAADGELSLRFETIRSIARSSLNSSLVTLQDGREIVLSDTRQVGRDNRGIYVDDPRYGRVLVSWEAFERLDFSPGGTGPAYGDFLPGEPLIGSVVTRSGQRLTGRLVYDLDESETTETLDAPSEGVDYTIPFSLIASIVPAGPEAPDAQPTTVTLHSGETLLLERTGDLGELNAGMLVFVEGGERPEYVNWTDVEHVDFDRPPAA